MAGYSGTPLARKLGIVPGSRLLLMHAPDGFVIPELPDETVLHHRPTSLPYDTILLFAAMRRVVETGFEPAARRLTTAGGLWVCWPKKASGLATDLRENDVRTIGLSAGLVDVKVCAVDETWSGLRFVRRVADR